MRAAFPGGSLRLQLFAGVVGLSGSCLNHDAGVAALVELALVGDGSHYVARTQPERRSQRRQRCYQHGDDDFSNLLLGHNSPPY